jgi:hypothetical protein
MPRRQWKKLVMSRFPFKWALWPGRLHATQHKQGPGTRLNPPHGAADAAFTLIEVLVASVILLAGVLSLFGLLDVTTKNSYETHSREGATSLARGILEDARTIPFSEIAPYSIVGELQAMPGMANTGSGSTWQIQQVGHTYTINVTECAVDEPKDGYGLHVNSYGENPFCADSSREWASGEKFDSTPEDLKRITVEVSWQARGGVAKRQVRLVETLTSAGAAPGLSAHGLHVIKPVEFPPGSNAEITNPLYEQLTFAVSSPPGTTAMRWSLEGVTQSTAPEHVGGTTWTFSWPIPISSVSDGTYQVSVQAIDASGVAGPPVSISVILIRSEPAAVSVTRGGFNTVYVGGVAKKVSELEWRANTERNVIGYRVYAPRGEGEATNKLVCPESMETLNAVTSCIDFNPPSPSSSNLKFGVVALYRGKANSSGERQVLQGPPGYFTLEGSPLLEAPHPPTGLEAEKNPNGTVTLRWKAPEGGPEVIFYRVYRGSTDYTSRFDTVPTSANPTYTDTDVEAEHSYWVTAVNKNLTESTFLGPVTK